MITVSGTLKKVLPSQLHEDDFLALVRAQGVRGAARALGVSAQAVSAHLKRLGWAPVHRPRLVCDMRPLDIRRKPHPVLDALPFVHVKERVEALGVDGAAHELCCTKSALLHYIRRVGCRVVFVVDLERADG